LVATAIHSPQRVRARAVGQERPEQHAETSAAERPRDRRARIIDELHVQAIATSDHVLAKRSTVEAKIRAIVLWRRVRFLIIGLVFLALIVVAL
jgi:hypothetical protein